MGRRRHSVDEENVELNLAPIMNMVMILIPLLLLSSVFIKAGVINISSPRNAQAAQADPEERPEEVPVPKVVVYIGQDGFRISDQRNLPEFAPFMQPIARCGGGGGAAAGAPGANIAAHDLQGIPPTICLRQGVDAGADLLAKLDFGALYNRLAEIRLQPQWFDRFGEENNAVISILGDVEVPFEVLVATMDAARYMLQPEGTELPAPSASSNIQSYMLGGGNPTPEDLGRAQYIKVDHAAVPLFPDPVLLLPRPSAGG
ncbi:MAG: biopolymer transporter ExbD [Myxococcales bacterium]|nr:biopolymer transporter ExbD [Myxococcales bacterium]